MSKGQVIAIGVVLLSALLYFFSTQNVNPEEQAKVNQIITTWKQKGEYFNFKGHNIFYIDFKNEKEVLLVIHGFPTSSWDFEYIMPNLTSRFHVVIFDLIGFGLSAKPTNYSYTITTQTDIALKLLDKLNIKTFHILAHDYGVSVAQELLARNSESDRFDISSVVFLNGGLFNSVYRPLITQKILGHPIVGPYMHYFMGIKTFTVSMNKIFGPEHRPTQTELLVFWELLNFNDGLQIMHALLGYINDRLENDKRWKEAVTKSTPKIPMRMINGPYDPVSGRHMAEEYQRIVPEADVVILRDTIGHYPHVEDPTGVVASLFQFWDKHNI